MNFDFINVAVSWALVGLIWVIQLVHYPTFSYVDNSDFLKFHAHHSNSISIIVLPLMLIELALAIYLAYQGQWNFAALIPLLFVLLIWASTFFIQVPLHQKLGQRKDLILIQKLVSTNWIRTIFWTIKAVWVSYYFQN